CARDEDKVAVPVGPPVGFDYW
nr:immunoglobulin heavy chain junction region [Macaca mulatta]MOX95799.1 immunoglobulin heavy chain junction region [Macaca mulatta]MOX96771.1 immunoglobulin heavy chain junction region [Macaca mulatta]